MSALPLPDNVFKLPKRPRILEKEAPPDQRKFAVVPLKAAMDPQLHHMAIRVLVLLCSYCNRAGITWVGQQRLADHLEVSKQAIQKAMKALKDAGYIEVVSKGFRGERANTTRVIFDKEISTVDAIAITSGQEDTRPPHQARKEIREATMQSEHPKSDLQGEPEFTEEQMAANRARLKQLLAGLSPKNHTTHQPVQIGAILMPKKTPRAAKKTPHIDNPQVVHEAVNNALHRQPDRQPGGCPNTENIGIHEVLSLYEEIIKRRFMVSVKTTENDLKAAEILCEVGVTANDIDLALSEQRNLVDIADQILNARVRG